MLYVSTGNVGPDINGQEREGMNLFTASIVALDIQTGKVRWFFQEMHHDLWDYDSTPPVVLFTVNNTPEHASPGPCGQVRTHVHPGPQDRHSPVSHGTIWGNSPTPQCYAVALVDSSDCPID